MNDKAISKFLSYALRHQPEKFGLTLESGGWAKVTDVLRALKENGMEISKSDLDHVVETNDKKRYSYSEKGDKIRAAQGHSVAVDLQLEAASPPETLYHGTPTRSVSGIMASGIQKMSRQHVHLSADLDTAEKVGARRGDFVVLSIAAKAMQVAGHVFYRADNGVWLTDNVPSGYITTPWK